MHFLVDENLPYAITELLRKYGYEVTDLVESGLRGLSDTDLWQLAHDKRQILVTRDLDFPLPMSKLTPSGLILIRVPDTFTRTNFLNLFEQFLKTVKPVDIKGNIVVISSNRVRFRKL